jgi:hypothetical protein
MHPLVAAVSVDPRRRDREIVLADATRAIANGQKLSWGTIDDPELLRQVGYLVDLVQHLRGQSATEADRLRAVRGRLPERAPCTFWPGERPLPEGTDPIAERWGFRRGVDVLRLRAALAGRVDLLPEKPPMEPS